MAARVLLDKYEVGPTLGKGLQGKVKLCTDTSTGAKVALKLIDQDKIDARPKEKANLEREIDAMKRLDHVHVVNMRDVAWDVDYPKKDGSSSRKVVAIVLDLAEGGELFDFMMYTGCFPEGIARAYFKQLLEGLEACHKASITHRDLKPENLLLDGKFQLKIADFGLSGVLENEDGTPTLLRTECGTRSYMAPEVLAGTPYRGAPADIWSSGVILFIMLAGFPPFSMATGTDWWFQRIRNKQYDLFWQAHLRNAMFSKPAMDLLNSIFTAAPGERATLETLKAHPWVTADSVPADALHAEVDRRKKEVERAKRAEREAAERKKEAERRRKAAAAAAGGDAVFDVYSNDTYRAIGDEEKVEDGRPAPDAPADISGISRYTNFYSKHGPGVLGMRLSQAFSEMVADYTLDEKKYKLKATVKGAGGTVQLTARIYNAPEDGLHRVDFERRQGDMLRFQEVYKGVCGYMSDVITAPPGEEGDEDAAGEAVVSSGAADAAAGASSGSGAGAGSSAAAVTEEDELI